MDRELSDHPRLRKTAWGSQEKVRSKFATDFPVTYQKVVPMLEMGGGM